MRIGRYEVIGRLGRGGMAEVLLTLEHDPVRDFKRLVVVKRVLPALENEDPQFSQMFLDEARLGARLNHANIVQTYEVGEEAGSPYLAIEFLEGQSLQVVQRRLHTLQKPMPVGVALRIFCDTLEGLHYAHDLRDFDGRPLGVIHRDVTPSNLFVRYDGLTKLVDFGIARSATQREKTRTGMIKGKMAYMAPEQLRDEAITRSVDVWAAGISIWETLAGERLFRGRNSLETVQAVMRREVPRLSERRSDVPASLDAVIAAAVERDPLKRIQTAEELKSRLEDVAVEMGRPPRRGDVATLIVDIFAQAIEQNRAMVKDFVSRTREPSQRQLLRVRTSGALEVSTDSEIPAEGSGDSGVRTMTPAGGQPAPSVRATGSLPSAALDDTLVDTRPAPERQNTSLSARPAAPESTALEPDEPARPWWHWAALLLVLGLVGTATWFLIR